MYGNDRAVTGPFHGIALWRADLRHTHREGNITLLDKNAGASTVLAPVVLSTSSLPDRPWSLALHIHLHP